MSTYRRMRRQARLARRGGLQPMMVIDTGDGFPETVGVLLARVKKKDTRPLLKGRDPKETIEGLLAVREPVYALADITLECPDESHQSALERMLAELRERGLET